MLNSAFYHLVFSLQLFELKADGLVGTLLHDAKLSLKVLRQPPCSRVTDGLETSLLVANSTTTSQMKSTKVQTLGAIALHATTDCTEDASIVGLVPLNWAIV